MNEPKQIKERQFIFFTKHDVLLILIICTIATILNMYGNPIFAAAVVVGGLLLMRVIEHREAEQKEAEQNHPSLKGQYIEKRSAHDIITQKLNEGAIEKAIDERFDQLLHDVVDEVFSDSGDVAKTIQTKLNDQIQTYIGHHDFSTYRPKIEQPAPKANNQDPVIQTLHQLIGTPPLKEVKTSELFTKFKTHVLENTKSVHGHNLMGRLVCEDTPSPSELHELKTITLTFDGEGDKEIGVVITLQRWLPFGHGELQENEQPWTIEGIKRGDGRVILRSTDTLTTLQTPQFHLVGLTDFDRYLLKLYYYGTSIVLDEPIIEDVMIEEFIDVENHTMAIPKISS